MYETERNKPFKADGCEVKYGCDGCEHLNKAGNLAEGPSSRPLAQHHPEMDMHNIQVSILKLNV